MAVPRKTGRPRWRKRRRNGPDRRRRSGSDEGSSPRHDSPPVSVRGVLDVLSDGRGYLRLAENRYSPDGKDVFVPLELISKHDLKTGCEIAGEAVQGRRNQRLRSVQTVMGGAPEEFKEVTPFPRLTCIDPIERLEVDRGNDSSLRIIDLIAPIGRGQRSLIVAPPRTGKTIILKKLAQAIREFHPEVHVMVVLIDERPEEVTDFKRSVDAEVIYSSNDEPATQSIRVVEIVLERARRLVEAGVDVVILLDSLTRVARAYNSETKDRGRTLSGGLGARTMEKPREFFGAGPKSGGRRQSDHGSHGPD